MFEVDFLPVGDADKSGDAIALRYSTPQGGYIHGIIDAGFEDDGDTLVSHVQSQYGTSQVDFVLLTHPDEDHISGMGKVMRELTVGNLLLHRPAQHGHPANSGAEPTEQLVELAEAQGTNVIEPFEGVSGFDSTMLIAGPTETYYEQQLAKQAVTTKAAAPPSYAARLREGAAKLAQKALSAFPVEFDFDDAGGTNPRNNSAAIVSFAIDGQHILLPSDAGVPAITAALDYLDTTGRTATYPSLFVLPHHGSRHNLDRATIERILGPHTSESRGTAVASVAKESPRPSPRVANAAGRRGYPVYTNRHGILWHPSPDAPPRNWPAARPLPPLVEDDHD